MPWVTLLAGCASGEQTAQTPPDPQTQMAALASRIAVLVGGSSTGKTRACWQVFDLADHTFVHEGVGWTTAEDVEAYICEASD